MVKPPTLFWLRTASFLLTNMRCRGKIRGWVKETSFRVGGEFEVGGGGGGLFIKFWTIIGVII